MTDSIPAPDPKEEEKFQPRRVLVCGGRDYHDAEQMEDELGDLLSVHDVVIHGGARGADALAGDIAGRVLGHRVEVYPADWHKHGKAAGPIRNQQMLDTGIDMVIAFPGGRGTDDMIRRARAADVEVHRSVQCPVLSATAWTFEHD